MELTPYFRLAVIEAETGMDRELTTVIRPSGPILNVLLTSDDQLGPGLADRECFHGIIARARSGGFEFS
jgi:hypothetical protein